MLQLLLAAALAVSPFYDAVDGTPSYSTSTSYPGTPAAGARFYHSGLGCTEVYNGSVWVPECAGSRRVFVDFSNTGMSYVENDYTAAVGTNAATNMGIFPGIRLYNYNYGTVSNVPALAVDATGLYWGGDFVATEGYEFYAGLSTDVGQAFVVGTDAAFELAVRLKVVDVSSHDLIAIGFRKNEAVLATFSVPSGLKTAYTDCAVFNIEAGDIKTITRANSGTAVETDLSVTDLVDDTWIVLTVRVSSAGAVTYLVDGSEPTGAVAFSFDAADTVIPFIRWHWRADGGLTSGDTVYLDWMAVGPQ